MKLSRNTTHSPRCYAAIMRNCLSHESVPLDCPVRKCRRDGFCAGPLCREDAGGVRLARSDAADVASGDLAVPVCFMHLTDPVLARVEQAYAANLRAFFGNPGFEILETTRVIASRSWRRLLRAEERVKPPQSTETPVTPPALC